MPPKMTTHQRMTRMLNHQEADRVPITDSLWGATLERWHNEGLPKDINWTEHFGFDQFSHIGVDNSPRFPHKVFESTDEYDLVFSAWGATQKNFKHRGGVPEFLDFTIKDRPSWEIVKARMTPTRDRVNWDQLKRDYPKWKAQGAWIEAGFWFGFDVTHSWAVGTTRVLEAMIDDPDWLVEMFNHWLDVDIALFEMVWQEGYHFDAIGWPDDLGYKGHQFFSPTMYRELLKPVHKRAADWARAKGCKVRLHSCGDVRPFIDDFLEIGVDILNPIEVKAGMDPLALKAKDGDRLTFHGGLNAALFWEPEKMLAHMRQVIPAMKQNGGYILSSDHSIPDSVSLAQFTEWVRVANELAAY